MRIMREFQSLDEFVDYVEAGKPAFPDRRASMGSRDRDWYQTTNLKQAFKFAREGWLPRTNLANEVAAITDSIGPTVSQIKHQKWDVTGKKVNVTRYAMGNPKAMRRTVRRPGEERKKSITLIVNAVASGTVPGELFLKRGIAIMALTQILASLGINMEVWTGYSVSSHKNHDSRWQAMVRVKAMTDPLDMTDMAFALGHPSFSRRLVFAAQEIENQRTVEHFNFRTGGGYGRIVELDLEDYPHTVAVPSLFGYGRSEYGANWIIDRLKDCGVQIRED